MNIEISPKEYERQLNWNDGMLYCQLLSIDGKDDWRLPTKDELDYIYHSKNDFEWQYHWSSTDYYDKYVWAQDFADGEPICVSNGKNWGRNYVRPVRTIE